MPETKTLLNSTYTVEYVTGTARGSVLSIEKPSGGGIYYEGCAADYVADEIASSTKREANAICRNFCLTV